MADLLATTTLVDCVASGTTGSVNMSPAACVLSDGTVLVGVTITTAAAPEIARVYRLDQSGTVLGTYEYRNDGWGGKDCGLIGLDDKQALLVVTNVQYSGDGPENTRVITLDCSGSAPVATGETVSPFVIEYTNGDNQRYHYRVPTLGYSVISGKNGLVVVSDAGVVTGSLAANRYVYGWFPHPTDPTKFAEMAYSGGYRGYEYTVGADGSLNRAERVEFRPAEDYWLFNAASPYAAAGLVTLEVADSATGADGWMLWQAGTSLGYEPPPGPAEYINVSGPMQPITPTNMVAVYEYVHDAGDRVYRYYPAVAEVDFEGVPTRTETLLDWNVSPGQVALSLTYGSWTMDARNGLLVIAGNSTTQDTHTFSATVWLLRVKSAAQGALKVEVAAGDWVTIGQRGDRTQGRLKVWTPMGWCWEWFDSDGPVKRWKLKVKTAEGWKDCGWFTNGERAE